MNRVMMLAAVLVAMAMAAPTAAQVDWAAVFDGKAGPSTCPAGHSGLNDEIFRIVLGPLKATEIRYETTSGLTRFGLQAVLTVFVTTSFPITGVIGLFGSTG